MSMVPSTMPSTALGFWSLKNNRPDSIVGKLALFAGGAFVVYHALDILEFLNKVVWNTITLGVGVGIIALAFLLLRNGRLIKLVDYGFQMIVRTIVGQFVAVFPMDVMKSRLAEIDQLLEKVTENLKDLRGARTKANDTLDKYRKELTEHDTQVDMTAQHPSQDLDEDQARIGFHVAAAQRRKTSIERFEKLVAQMDLVLKILGKLKVKAGFIRADISDNIEFTQQDRQALQAATSAIRSIKTIMMGGDVGAELYDMALEAANQQAADMIGEIEQFMVDSRDVMRGFELEQYAAVDQALVRLSEREGSSKALDYQPGAARLALEHKPGEPMPMLRPSPTEVTDDISRFLKK